MATRYQAERDTIGSLLSMTNPPIVVPDWQRSYSWTTSEIETFWMDLIRFSRQYPEDNINGEEYFLGSVVIVDTGQSHLLLDGQQRLATSAILLSVIRDYLHQYSRDAAIRVTTRYLTDFDDAANRVTYKLTLNVYDRDFFQREVLESYTTDYSPPTPTLDSHNLIRKAREFFSVQFEQEYSLATNPADAAQWALRILTLLTNHVSVVAVKTSDEDNAANVFETLNDRGIGLSTPDLTRNLLLRRAREDTREEISSLWGEVLEIGGDTKVKAFLRHYWISYEGDIKTRSLYREIKAAVLQRNSDSLLFSRALRDAASNYKDILSCRHSDETCERLFSDIGSLNAQVLYPALLSALDRLEPRGIAILVRGLLVAFVRHNIIGQLENSRLESCVFGIARDLRVSGDLARAIEQLREFAPDDDSFERAFRTVSVSRQPAARYILRELEHAMRETGELEVSTPSRVHVEHIYPRTPLPDLKWPDHAQRVNRIGNLTLLARRLNESLRNAEFSRKQPVYGTSDFRMTQAVATRPGWTPEEIDRRQCELADLVAGIWAFPSLP